MATKATNREELLAEAAEAIVQAAYISFGDTVEATSWCELAAEYAFAVFEKGYAQAEG